MKRLGWLLVIFVLAGCAGTSSRDGGAERPSADQPVTTEVRKVARSHVELGTAYVSASRFGTALEEARLAIGIDPTYAPGYNLLGLVHMYLDEKGPALKAFEKAVEIAPGDPEISNTYGWFLCNIGREKEGLEVLAKAAANPFYNTPTRPYTNSGLCQLRLKDDDAAAANFARALALDGGNTVAVYHLAAIAYRKGDISRARDLVTELNRMSTPTAESIWLGLKIARKQGDREAEATYISQLRKGFATSSQYQDYLAGRFE